jgi:hypothetical protein
MHTKAAGLVRSSANNRAPTLPGNNYRFAAQMRIIPLLNRGIKRVHVDMDDLSHNRPIVR